MADKTTTDNIGNGTEPVQPGAEDVDNDVLVAKTEAMRRRNVALANDDADASHSGGMGAQGGAADFGNPKNFGT